MCRGCTLYFFFCLFCFWYNVSSDCGSERNGEQCCILFLCFVSLTVYSMLILLNALVCQVREGEGLDEGNEATGLQFTYKRRCQHLCQTGIYLSVCLLFWCKWEIGFMNCPLLIFIRFYFCFTHSESVWMQILKILSEDCSASPPPPPPPPPLSFITKVPAESRVLTGWC